MNQVKLYSPNGALLPAVRAKRPPSLTVRNGDHRLVRTLSASLTQSRFGDGQDKNTNELDPPWVGYVARMICVGNTRLPGDVPCMWKI
jgi:hypothetical protein